MMKICGKKNPKFHINIRIRKECCVMECPRCGGDMSSGVCEDCGFPETKIKLIRYEVKENK